MKKLITILLIFNFQLLINNCQAQSPIDSVASAHALLYTTNTNSVDVGLMGGLGSNSTSSFSVETWVKFNTTSSPQTVVSRWYGGPGVGRFGWLLYMSSPGTLALVFNKSQIIDKNISYSGVQPNQWYHLAFTYDASTISFYVNGVLIGTNTSPGGTSNTITMAIGSYSVFHPTLCIGCNVYSLDGYVDETRIWSKTLAQTEIQQNMCKKLLGNEPNLAGYWKMDEGADNTCSGGEDICDISGNGNHGTKY